MTMNPQRLITPALRQALKEYYQKRDLQNNKAIPWDKEESINKILKVFRQHKQAGRFEGCAGTFWLTWKCGVQTTHNEDNYWQGKVFSRRQQDGTWKTVDF